MKTTTLTFLALTVLLQSDSVIGRTSKERYRAGETEKQRHIKDPAKVKQLYERYP